MSNPRTSEGSVRPFTCSTSHMVSTSSKYHCVRVCVGGCNVVRDHDNINVWFVDTNTHTVTYTHTRLHTFMDSCTHTYAQTHTHTHTLKHTSFMSQLHSQTKSTGEIFAASAIRSICVASNRSRPTQAVYRRIHTHVCVCVCLYINVCVCVC
jgi:hypothetical protein